MNITKAIELLKNACETVNDLENNHGVSFESETIADIIDQVLEELKTPHKKSSDRRIRCNWCMSEFDEDKIELHDEDPHEEPLETCPVCGKDGYLVDMPDDQESEGNFEKG
jgi:hypothetical protein